MPPRIKVFIPKKFSKIKRNHQDSIKSDSQCSGEELSMEEEINNKIVCQVNSNTPEEEARQKEPEMKMSKALPSEPQSKVNMNKVNRGYNNMDLSEGRSEGTIRRNKKREAMSSNII
ncbi:hypothetical protein O181_010897 [Austropuccinia psidii MF-1]|uniref:Uncharacterized protein n=1 Tax=Austropuccinia psidii MF-1 TaxID=1389203 RepID=A0A9Q3BUN3_9BASI|nr:hypothetical protein [Austropuccinia psidii MF-1]